MDTDVIHKLARSYNIELSDDEAIILSRIMQSLRVEKGSSVADLHRYNRHMYYIEHGALRQYYYKDGRNITEHFGIENDVMFSIESLFLGQPSQQGIEAIEPSLVHSIDYASFKELTYDYRGIGLLYQKIMEKSLVLSQRKADSWRFESSQERYNRFCREYPDIARRVSVAQLASYLLMSPETLSRVRAGVL